MKEETSRLNPAPSSEQEPLYATEEKLQCVEFARRWLSSNTGLVYGDVDIAADIWDKIDYYTRVVDGRQVPVVNVLNGAPRPPGFGDLIIYSEKFLDTGHVAVITGVDLQTGLVKVGEQNYANQYHPPYQLRHIPMISKDDRYWLLDGYLLGWKQLQY